MSDVGVSDVGIQVAKGISIMGFKTLTYLVIIALSQSTMANAQSGSGITYFQPSSPLSSGVTAFAPAAGTSGVAASNIQTENTVLTAGPILNTQGGLATVPGGDNATKASNGTNATSSTSGRGLSNRR